MGAAWSGRPLIKQGGQRMAQDMIPEETRREVFAALVEAQDLGDSVQESRAMVANRFNLTEHDVRTIEREGLEALWPPLE
jgi:hypothetical protein